MKLSSRWGIGLSLAATLVAAYFAPDTEAEHLQLSDRTRAAASRVQSPVARSKDGSTAREATVHVLAIRPRGTAELESNAAWFDARQRLQAQPQRVAIVAPAASAPAEAAQAPALPFRPFGRYVEDGQQVIFLLHNDQNLVVRVGDTIAQQYRVESLDGNKLTLRYLPLDQEQTLDLGGSSN